MKRSEAVAYLVAHQRVVETVMQRYPLLPVKFGTVIADEGQVHHLLAQGEPLFRSALDKYGKRVQMEVVVLWNIQQIFQDIAQEESIIQAKTQLSNCAPEESLNKQIALGQLVQTSVEQRRAALRAEILPSLQDLTLETVANPLMDDNMVLNVALLLDENGCQALDQRLEELDAIFESRNSNECTPLTFRRVGPLPPYSFATLEVQAISFDVVNAARQRLGLKEIATPEEIKRAYHRLVFQFHPDLNPNRLDAEASINDLTQAYRLLAAYAESRSLASGSLCAFDRATVTQTLLVTIQRQDTVLYKA
jgi:hypothetical protein